MIKRYTENIYLDFYLNAADKLGIKFKLIAPPSATAELVKGNEKLIVSCALLSVNSEIASLSAKNKFKTYQLLKQNNLPHPNAILIHENLKSSTIYKILKSKKIAQPWVIKPQKGMGGAGVSVNLTEITQSTKAIKLAREHHKNILIEEYTKGENYRVLIFQNQIIDIVKRVPAYIISNKSNTIEELITAKNKKRKDVGLKPIKIDQELKRNLTNLGLTLQTKNTKNREIVLRNNCNMSTGGETQRIKLSQIHKDNLKLFVNSVNLLRLNFAGIDFITPDISKSYKNIKCIINEINRAPGLDAHYFADMKLDNFAAEKILKIYFSC